MNGQESLVGRSAIVVRRAILALPPLALLASLPASAQPEHPNHRRGLDTPTAYNYDQLDAVNLFNGNNSVRIAIAELQVGGDLVVPIAAHYNSNIWGFEEGPPATEPPNEPTVTARVDPHQNAGAGWLVSLGKMWPPFTPPWNDGPGWLLVEPDGTRRVFVSTLHPSGPEHPDFGYTTDGSFLRSHRFSNVFQVESPNGLVREFRTTDGNLLAIRDRFGNQIEITYGANLWTLQDNAFPSGRTHTIEFYPASGDLPQRVKRINLAAFGGTSAVYDFTYDEIWIPRHYKHTSDGAPGGLPAVVNVALLQRITLPASAGSYQMQYHLTNSSTFDTNNPSGALRRLDLPTGARYEWDYALWGLAISGPPYPQTWHLDNDGVRFKRIYSLSGNLEGQWAYVSGLGNGRPDGSFPVEPWSEKQTRVTNPLSQVTLHYFTSRPDTWVHGLPLADQITDGSRFLSRQVFNGSVSMANLVRSEWSLFTSDSSLSSSNQRLTGSRTVFHDDGGKWLGVDYSDDDGLSHFRTATTSGNFDSGNVRTTHTAYNRDGQDSHDSGTYPGAFTMWPTTLPWVINTFELQWELEGGTTATKTLVVDPPTGWVSRSRIHRLNGTGTSTTDVVVATDHDGRGNLSSERFYGGDNQALGTGPLGSLALPAFPAYRIDHTTLYGTRATSTYVASGVPMSFNSLDCGDDPATGAYDPGIDASTGLPSRCRDTSRIGTNFEYDALGRLRWEKPDSGHDGWTEFVHSAATPLESASVAVFRRPNGGGIPLAESSVAFDGFGRVSLEREKMPDGSISTRETLFNAMGWKTSVSEQGNTSKTTQFLSYDPFGRPGTIRPPDGAAHEVTLVYTGVRSVARLVKVATALNSETTASTTSFYDRQGRLFQVKEEADRDGLGQPANTTTTYAYDVGNRLASVTQQTSVGTQTRLFNYDQRGFLLSERHPEKGAGGNGFVTYSSYDARGHAGRKQDGPFDLTFVYDAAERLVLVRESGSGFVGCSDTSPRCLKSFTYGTSNAPSLRTNGRLEQAVRYNYMADLNATLQVYETYAYGARQGRVSTRDTTFFWTGAFHERFSQSYSYDPLGNVKDLSYPECAPGSGDCTTPTPRPVSFSRTNGRLTSIPGFASSISYYPNGLYKRISHANGVVDEQTNDLDGMRRPRELFAQRGGSDLWRSGVYQYDGAGNVKRTGNGYFIYDRVSRIVDGHVQDGPTGGGTQRFQTYTYDPFGNLTKIGGDPSGRDTPTSAATNRLDPATATYDAAGNLIAWNGNSYSYDALGMMTKLVTPSLARRFLYTADDERFWTYQIGGAYSTFELRDLDGKVLREYQAHTSWTTAKDYVYRDGHVLATAHPSEGVRHLHLDHLGTPRLVTGSGGGGGFYTLTPCRVIDTRSQGGPLTPGTERTVTMVGACGIPATATSVSVNITAADPTSTGELTAYPGFEPIPNPATSAISYRAGLTRANNAVLKLGGGALAFYNNEPAGGTVHLIVDVNGYFAEAGDGQVVAYHVYFPFGEELTPALQDVEQMKFTGHERDLNVLASTADDLDFMHARFYNPQLGRFLRVDPVLNRKRAVSRPQNWNRYAYAMGNPMKYVDPTGEDISLGLHFAGSITEEERTRILAAIKAWYEANGAGKAYVFDAAKAKHGGNFFSRLFGKGYQTISVSGEMSRQHTPGVVYAGNFRGLPGRQFVNAVSNSILHETAAHLFGVTPVNVGDTMVFSRDLYWIRSEPVSSRVGTVADSQAFGDPATRANVTEGPIPVHPEDAATIARELGPLEVELPE